MYNGGRTQNAARKVKISEHVSKQNVIEGGVNLSPFRAVGLTRITCERVFLVLARFISCRERMAHFFSARSYRPFSCLVTWRLVWRGRCFGWCSHLSFQCLSLLFLRVFTYVFLFGLRAIDRVWRTPPLLSGEEPFCCLAFVQLWQVVAAKLLRTFSKVRVN